MPDTSMRLSKEHARELELLRFAWEMKTLDEVLERLIAPQRLEKIKALGIKVEMPDEQPPDSEKGLTPASGKGI